MLQYVLGTGSTIGEALEKAQDQYNGNPGTKQIIRIETKVVPNTGQYHTVIWFEQTRETMTIPAKKTQRFIGMPVDTDPLNPAHN